MSTAKYFHQIVTYMKQSIGELTNKDTRINNEQFELSTQEAKPAIRSIGDALEVLTPLLAQRGSVKLSGMQVNAVRILMANASDDISWFASEHSTYGDALRSLETKKEGV